jgi:hypothetical protein
VYGAPQLSFRALCAQDDVLPLTYMQLTAKMEAAAAADASAEGSGSDEPTARLRRQWWLWQLRSSTGLRAVAKSIRVRSNHFIHGLQTSILIRIELPLVIDRLQLISPRPHRRLTPCSCRVTAHFMSCVAVTLIALLCLTEYLLMVRRVGEEERLSG